MYYYIIAVFLMRKTAEFVEVRIRRSIFSYSVYCSWIWAIEALFRYIIFTLPCLLTYIVFVRQSSQSLPFTLVLSFVYRQMAITTQMRSMGLSMR